MLSSDEILKRKMISVYASKVKNFFEELRQLDFSEKELGAVPALFLPGWGEGYSTSVLKIAIAGKETLNWGTNVGDSLLADLIAFKNNSYCPTLSCERFRKEGPAEWLNKFWQYSASSIGKVFEQDKNEVLAKNSPILQSIAWFNGHAIETYKSKGVTREDIASEKMQFLQNLADKHGLSSFETFVNVFRPHVILYFYRDSDGISIRNRCEENGCEFRQAWGANEAIREYQMEDSLILNLRHPSWMTRGNMTEKDCADIIAHVMQVRGLCSRLPSSHSQHYNLDSMSAHIWRHWVSIVREEAAGYPDMNDLDLSRHLILTIARELRKTKSTMTAQTLVLLLNEVPKFQNDCWQYSPERRGPCSSVRGAYNEYANAGNANDATVIAEAFTKLNGEMAYE